MAWRGRESCCVIPLKGVDINMQTSQTLFLPYTYQIHLNQHQQQPSNKESRLWWSCMCSCCYNHRWYLQAQTKVSSTSNIRSILQHHNAYPHIHQMSNLKLISQQLFFMLPLWWLWKAQTLQKQKQHLVTFKSQSTSRCLK